MQLAKLNDGTESLKTAKSFDQGFSGIVGEEYYGYSTVDGFREVGNSSLDDPKRRLEALSSNIESAASTQGSVGGRLENQLEDLGYL
ncbi:hypothetical protein SAMN05444422_111124 [Halobiforma haloterrestris]|uniref:Uncharacterized protein n=1 Tax=Natronobacterium haloterrestre TaxID=148448 RepID=A0A1I1KGA0_NATHA|nr:hypothetical protein [Halobiforma haloterrestris]SFC59984.1 hypothetical protein SAMN05444422_111124 [Halobiforma haloterrestris]